MLQPFAISRARKTKKGTGLRRLKSTALAKKSPLTNRLKWKSIEQALAACYSPFPVSPLDPFIFPSSLFFFLFRLMCVLLNAGSFAR